MKRHRRRILQLRGQMCTRDQPSALCRTARQCRSATESIRSSQCRRHRKRISSEEQSPSLTLQSRHRSPICLALDPVRSYLNSAFVFISSSLDFESQLLLCSQLPQHLGRRLRGVLLARQRTKQTQRVNNDPDAHDKHQRGSDGSHAQEEGAIVGAAVRLPAEKQICPAGRSSSAQMRGGCMC